MSAIAFVSFKGGSGRSVSLANIAFQAVTKLGKTVGCIDADIESGGLHTVFGLNAPFDEFDGAANMWTEYFPTQVYLSQDVFRDEEMRKHGVEVTDATMWPSIVRDRFAIDVSKHTIPLYLKESLSGPNVGRLFLIAAAANATLTGRVETGGDMFPHFLHLLQDYKEGCKLDHLFVDCRSGISKLGLPPLMFVDATVVCMRWGAQHRAGTERLIRWYSNWMAQRPRKSKIFLLVASPDKAGLRKGSAEAFVKEAGLTKTIEGIFHVPFLPDLLHKDRIVLEDDAVKYQQAIHEIAAALTALEPVGKSSS